MSTLSQVLCVPYDAKIHRSDWNRFIEVSSFHPSIISRDFLDYHGDRFVEQSLLFINKRSGRLDGIFPAASHPLKNDLVVSHPGVSFGGLLLKKNDPDQYAQCLQKSCAYYGQNGFSKLRVKTIPTFVGHQANDLAIHHAMKYAQVIDSHLWAYVNLHRQFNNKKASYDARRAARNGLSSTTLNIETDDWRTFHAMLVDNLGERHDVKPVHSLIEMLEIHKRMDGKSHLFIAHLPTGEVAAGTWVWDYGNGVVHTQYIASTAKGREMGAVDFIVNNAVDWAREKNKSIFSIGISSLGNGWKINQGLLSFKLKFGAGLCQASVFDYGLSTNG